MQSEMQTPALVAALEVPLAVTEISCIPPQQGELQGRWETCGGQLPIYFPCCRCKNLQSLPLNTRCISRSPATKEQKIA